MIQVPLQENPRNNTPRFVKEVEILHLMLDVKRYPFETEHIYAYKLKRLSICEFVFLSNYPFFFRQSEEDEPIMPLKNCFSLSLLISERN